VRHNKKELEVNKEYIFLGFWKIARKQKLYIKKNTAS